jgi:3-ketosteroid 9alpha-monooxygenase subunit A
MRGGWHQVAFRRELTAEVTPLQIERPLVAVRAGDRIRVFDAVCPHRGAHLGHGGTLDGAAIVCPFHARRVGLGAASGLAECVAEHPTLSVGGMVFARLSSDGSGELESMLRAIDRDHYYIAGFSMNVPCPAELVIENGFDAAHFQPVHAVCEPPRLEVVAAADGAMRAQGRFVLPRSLWQSGPGNTVTVPYTACALSPGIVLSHLGGQHPYYVLTAATPLAPRECLVRLSVAVPAGPGGVAPDTERCEYLIAQMQRGLEQDLVIWRHLSVGAPQRYTVEDAPVAAFRRYVNRFPELS